MKVIVSVFLFFLFNDSFGQVVPSIRGQVIDPEKKPVMLATVSLLRVADSTLLKTILTNTRGEFEFKDMPQGRYLLVASMIGFKKYHGAQVHIDQVSVILPPIQLEPDEKVLKEIKVSSRKPLVEQRADRTIVNVDAFLSNSGVTALEVLENSPGIQVDDNGSISLKGKNGVQVFIDDRPTYLSGIDLINYLKSLPSGTLERIEIMTNPPARYSAEGNAGVINIRTRKNNIAGFNGGFTLNYNQGKYARTNNSFNFNYRNAKINIFGTAGYSIANSLNDLDIFRYYYKDDKSLQSTFFQNSFIRRTNHTSALKLGADYVLNSKTTIGILINGILRPAHEKTINRSTVRNLAGLTDSIITADNTQRSKWKNGSVNLNYVHKFNEASDVSFDLDYIRYNSEVSQDFLNGIYSASGTLKSSDGLNGFLPSYIDIYSVKGDYAHAIGKSARIESGAKISYVNTDNAANYFTIINNVTRPDYDKTNHFLYKETINAAYVNFNKDWKQLSLQSGLRLENTISNGHQLGNGVKPDSAFRRSYTDLFPTFYLLYKLDSLSRNQIAFSYGRRIDRPYYQDLNPFISPLDKFSVYVGNPYLRPTFTNILELSHIFRNKVTTSFSYSFTTDVIEETIDLSNSIYISRPANIGRSSVIGLSVSTALNPAKWWSNTIYAEVQNRYFKDVVYGYLLDTSSVYFGANLTSQFILGKGWSAEVAGNYRTGILVGQIISSQTGQVNAGLGKKILHNKGSLKFNMRDIFHTRLNHGIITSIKNAYATYHNWADSRQYALSFSYNFGKVTASQRKRNSGAETEQNRVKD